MTTTQPSTPLTAPPSAAALLSADARRLLLATVGAASLLALTALAAPAAAQICAAGTKTQPSCKLDPQGPVNATIDLPTEGVTRTVTSPATYSGPNECANRFVVGIAGEEHWTRLAARPRSGPTGGWDECTCANMVLDVTVMALSKGTYCEGGCADCTTAAYCADPSRCYQCSWTLAGLPSWPTERKSAHGTWVTASPLTGTAHCELKVAFWRDSSSPAWTGSGAIVAAVVWDRRSGTRYPVIVEARNSAVDGEILNGGCPSCH